MEHSSASDWQALIHRFCPYVFASQVLTISAAHYQQMGEVIAAVERVVKLPGWYDEPTPNAALGVFMGYDFHLNQQGAHLIEINTNAGGGWLNSWRWQQSTALWLAMFRQEWHRARGDAPLRHVVIVDEQPEQQYLYPEFLLAQRAFSDAGIVCEIVAPEQLVEMHGIDLIYNRLTDFSLQRYPALLHAYQQNQLVVTPNPHVYQRYADKRNLVRLSNSESLQALGVTQQDRLTLQQGIPETRLITTGDESQWWDERKFWFFKPVSGYGSKGAYRGDKLTKRVFADIMQGGYVAQKLAPPGELGDFKYDVRCYVYDGQLQLMAARLFQGQTVNFRTPGGGFAAVQLAEGLAGS